MVGRGREGMENEHQKPIQNNTKSKQQQKKRRKKAKQTNSEREIIFVGEGKNDMIFPKVFKKKKAKQNKKAFVRLCVYKSWSADIG